jgi:hypothetical protein
MRTRSAFRFTSVCVSLALVFATACSNQGEGEICDIDAGDAGDDDCQSGLVCTSLSGVVGPRCCPSDLNQAKTAVCAINHQAVTANPAPPDGAAEATEASPGDGAMAGPSDATPDATPDAPADAPGASIPDAAGEASADVGADGG